MGDRLKGKVAVVTGSGQGIGRAMAIALAKEGAKVVTNNRRPGTDGGDAETTAKAVRDMGGQAIAFFAEIGSMEVGEKIVETAVKNFGRIDILVNSAALNRDRMVWNMSEEEWDEVIKVILKGTFACTKFACIKMREQRSGRIINVTSESGLDGNSGQPNYSSAKSGVAGFTKSCALALGRSGITVNAIAPQADTRMWRSIPVDRVRDVAVMRGLITKEEAGRLTLDEVYDAIGHPEGVANLVTYLATDEAANVNGQIFYASGGRISIYAPSNKMQTIFKKGGWNLDDLLSVMPATLTKNLVNPAPPEPSKT